MITPDLLPLLRDPRRALPAYGFVTTQQGQGRKTSIPYNPDTLTVKAQRDVLAYWYSPPIDPTTGMTRWRIDLKGRQVGLSTTAEAAAYVITSTAESWQHLCVADTPKRAEELLARINELHDRWDPEVRFERRYNNEMWQANFAPVFVGDVRLSSRRMLTQHTGLAPIGAAWDSVHWSEVDFSGEDAGQYWSALQPSLINRTHSIVHLESTANPGTQTASVGYLKEMYFAAKNSRSDDSPNRFDACFYPFWDGRLNTRPWQPGWAPDLEELRLLERYSATGLTLNNLAFRRGMMSSDPELRRNPELFGIWYPFDDMTCWPALAGQTFRPHHLARHLGAPHLVPWAPTENAMFYPGRRKPAGEPDPDAGYVMGVDPNGYGGRDHGAAELREVWADEQREVASFAGGKREGVNPEVLAKWIVETSRRWREAGARILVVVESTGVGAGVLALLRQHPEVDLYHTDVERPGVPASQQKKQEALAAHLDALMDDLVLHDADKVGQHGNYRNDKAVEETDTALQLQDGNTSRRRRARHHWDKVSACMWTSWAVQTGKVRRPFVPAPALPPMTHCVTAADWDAYAALARKGYASSGPRYKGLP